MRLELSRAHYPVTALGHGRRVAIWVQGCTIGCRGCVSRDTWPADPSKEIEVDALLAWCTRPAVADIDGVTISGGEPFEQVDAITELLTGLDQWRRGRPEPVDLLCYTGLPLERARAVAPLAVSLLDAIVSEPFVRTLPTEHLLMGSANQKLTALTHLGAARYAGVEDERSERRFQVAVDDDEVWFVGIPRRGDMDRLRVALTARGVQQGPPSWAP